MAGYRGNFAVKNAGMDHGAPDSVLENRERHSSQITGERKTTCR